jgi:hypothetical protein
VTTVLVASRQVAESCTVGLVARLSEADGGVMCTDATAASTFTADEPVFVSAVATIEVGPALTPVTVVVAPP